jgi:hypothetical protein
MRGVTVEVEIDDVEPAVRTWPASELHNHEGPKLIEPSLPQDANQERKCNRMKDCWGVVDA